MEHVLNGSLEDRLKRIERKISILSLLSLSSFLALRTEKKWAIKLFLFADLLVMADLASDLIKELHYKLTHKK